MASSPCSRRCSRRERASANTSAFDEEQLAVDTKRLKSHHSHRNAKAAVARDDLARTTMNGIRHVEQKVDRLRVPLRLVLARKGPSPAGLLRTIFSLNNLNPPHDQLPAIAVRDQMICVAKWMRLTRECHKTEFMEDSLMHKSHDGLYPLE